MGMKEPGISLCQYLQKQQIDDEKREAHGLSLICRKCEVGKALPGTAMIPFLIQKMRNEIFIQEIIRIREAFEKGGEKVIFIKGVPLAEEFGQLRMHFPVFQKRMTDKDGKEKTICLDCHICIFPNLSNCRENMDRCFKNAVSQLFHGHDIYILALYHRILHLMTHFIKDTYRDNPFWIFTGWKAGYHAVKLNLLHDIALLLYKYEEVFDWQKFYETAREFNQIIPAYYMIQFLKEIYGLTVPGDIEKKLSDSFPQSRTFMETVLASCGERKVSEILFMDQYEVMRDILPGICFKGEVSGDDYVKEFYIKGPGNRLKNLEDSRTLVSYSEYAKGRICIKENTLLFSVRIFGGEKYASNF